MLKIRFLFVLFLSSLFLIVGCEKDKEEMEIIPAPKLEITVTPGTYVLAGTDVIFTFKVENLESLEMNDEPIAFSALTKKVEAAKTSFVFKGKGKNGEYVVKSITITTYVVDPPKSKFSIATDEDSLLPWNKAHVTIVAENMINVLLNGQPVTSNAFDVNAPLDTIPLKFKIQGVGSKGELLKDSIYIATDFKSSYLIGAFTTTDSVQWKNHEGVWEHYYNYPEELLSDTLFYFEKICILKSCGDVITVDWSWGANQTILKYKNGGYGYVVEITPDRLIVMNYQKLLKIYFTLHRMSNF